MAEALVGVLGGFGLYTMLEETAKWHHKWREVDLFQLGKEDLTYDGESRHF